VAEDHDWGKFAKDATDWASLLLRIKRAAEEDIIVTLTSDEAKLVIQFTQIMARGVKAEKADADVVAKLADIRRAWDRRESGGITEKAFQDAMYNALNP
jgi:hypothetical protein